MSSASQARSGSTPRNRIRRLAAVLLAPALLLGVSGCMTGIGPSAERPSPAATEPSVEPSPSAEPDPAETALATMTLEQKIASLLILHTPGTDGAAQRAFIDRYGLGGVILMGANIPGGTEATDTAALAAMTATIRGDDEIPPFIGIDQEGGEVVRVGPDPAPGADQLRGLPVEATEQAFQARSTMLADAGISLNFGVVADVSADPSSFIYGRSLGGDAAASSARVAAAVTGEGDRVLSTIKHFPGHGAAPGDSHVGIPSSEMRYLDWTRQEAPPFRAGIDAGADFVMFGHLAFPAIDAQPASLSSAWHHILREQLGFTGLCISDDMRMLQDSGDPRYADPVQNVIAAFAAGTSIVLYTLPADPATIGVDIDAVIRGVADAVRSGHISAEQIDADALAALRLRETA
ncbi:beta-N-acetylhexosaminidase [Microterricola gilva]|uniref:beta-N-acetylhexosaminidase n=1 Tax=Microterricola gilva TaxID=393267 RepID=A0A4Q8AKV6_9MICO|nr:glycoside hydrolase family 3 N-terminal domain-containing protein [Microterricola gilva]RZU65157.1 beta-N-acetylhexosaminidase [Microterricola gilva]